MKKILILVCLISGFNPSIVAAISPADLHAINYDTPFYSEGDSATSTCGDSTSSGPLLGSENGEKVYNFFIAKGLTPIQTAGIMGNLAWESGGPNFNPLSQQDGSSDTSPKNGVGFGIAQWTYTDRQQPLVDMAKKQNVAVGTLGVQLDYVWHEMQTNRGSTLPNLKKTTTVPDAVHTFMIDFEAPGIPHEDKRLNYATGFLAKYGGAALATSPSLSQSSGCADITGSNTTFIDGFTVYSQVDTAWKNTAYGTSTIGEAGCGPSAMAMIITNLTGQKVSPVATAAYGAAHGSFADGQGSYHNIAAILAPNWGLKAVPIGANVARINDTLKSGGLVIAAGHGALPFTSIGHFIVIRALTATGQWKVGDSGHSATNNQEWDPIQLISEMSGDSVYAVTK